MEPDQKRMTIKKRDIKNSVSFISGEFPNEWDWKILTFNNFLDLTEMDFDVIWPLKEEIMDYQIANNDMLNNNNNKEEGEE